MSWVRVRPEAAHFSLQVSLNCVLAGRCLLYTNLLGGVAIVTAVVHQRLKNGYSRPDTTDQGERGRQGEGEVVGTWEWDTEREGVGREKG